MSEEEKQLPENDDWLNDFDESTDDIESADDGQDDFDELFESFEAEDKGGAEESAESLESAPEGGSEVVEEADELDQASIDALLGTSGSEEPLADEEEIPTEEALAEEAVDPLDQSSIDELLGSDDAAPEVPPGSTDDYISSPAEVEAEAETGTEEKAAGAAEESVEAETLDFEEVLGADAGGEEPVEDAGEEEFVGDELDDEFDFGDELDSFEDDDEIMQAVGETPLDDLFGDDEQSSATDISDEETVITTATVTEESGETSAPVLPGFMAKLARVDRKKAAIGAIVLLFLIGGTGLILNSIGGGNNKPAIVLPDQETIAGVDDQSTVNMPPQAKSSGFSLTTDAAEVDVKLDADDPEGAKLSYEIVELPKYGRLSGEPPFLTYHADSTFAGNDTFKFRVNDGTQASQPEVVSIEGPDIAARLAGPIVIEPKRQIVKANDQKVEAVSTEPLIIDWRDIWKRDNEGSMKNVSVEVSKDGLKGTLARLDKYRHKYTPDPFSEGMEEFGFRFKKRGVKSKFRKLKMAVASGNPKPDLIVAKLDKESYAIGETVVLDASKTRDNKRESVMFDYQQLAGVPVHFNFLNEEGSKVSFIMPSSFYTTDYPEPLIKLTAVDETGKTDSVDIRIKLKKDSFIQASLWDGLQDGGPAGPNCPTGNCPGSRLH